MNDLMLFARAFSDPTRIRILSALCGGELCVCELVDALELGQSTLSTHLQVVRQAGLVATTKRGKWIYYSLEPEQAGNVKMLLSLYKAALEADRRLQRDAERLAQRLCLREDGCCVVGLIAAGCEKPSVQGKRK